MHQFRSPAYFVPILILLFFIACQEDKAVKKIKAKELVSDPRSIDAAVKKNIAELIQFATRNDGKLNDSFKIDLLPVVQKLYEKREFSGEYHNRSSTGRTCLL